MQMKVKIIPRCHELKLNLHRRRLFECRRMGLTINLSNDQKINRRRSKTRHFDWVRAVKHGGHYTNELLESSNWRGSYSNGCYILNGTKCLTDKLIGTTRRRKGGKELEKEALKLTKKTRLESIPAGSHVDNAALQRTKDLVEWLKRSWTYS